MRKRISAFITPAAAVVLLLSACNNEGVTEEGTDFEEEQIEENEGAEETDDSGEAGVSEEVEDEIDQEPFEPVEPSENTESVESHYDEHQVSYIPGIGADGEPVERSVPLGEVLSEGVEDLSEGPLNKYRLVAFYGTPLSEHMGILGEYEPEEMMEILKKQTEAYSEIDPARPAVPTIELIATIAQRDPGPDGNYVSEPVPEVIEEYVELAEKHNALLMLDVQLGGKSVMEEVEQLEPYLKEPHVHLTIDTEYSISEGEIPGIDLGSVDGTEIQEAVEYMDRLTEENNLPDKIVLVHQFADSVVTNKNEIQPTENVQVSLNFDGFGDESVKIDGYNHLVRNEPVQYSGFKLFYQDDVPLLEPEDVLELDPAPSVVNYQ
ncbi:hypothetical protein [Corticicoccus populi]|uniref:Lipoprotein n=1 Tax=Corticicoccus populi TaxID=1812821 RepID=A0ABW5WS76_9STAP